jgi:hypothetical protein
MNRQQRRAAGRKTSAQPYRNAEGVTNDEALAAIAEVLGKPPERGALYRVRFGQGSPPRPVQFIGEYLGLAEDYVTGAPEIAMRFAIRNPVLPADAPHGTSENPFVIWPLDVQYIAPAEPGDLDTPLSYRVEGEDTMPPPGRPRVS